MKKNNIVTLRPFCYIRPSLDTMTAGVIAVLVPQLVMLFVTDSYRSLILLGCTTAASVLAECIDAAALRHKRGDWNVALLQGLLIGMFLPASYPFASAFFIALCTLLVAKYAFGGLAGSWINPVAAVIIIAYFVGAVWFPAYSVPAGYLQTRNVSLALIQDGVIPTLPADSSVTAFLNETVFAFLGTSIPDGYVSLLWDSGAAVPAFRFNILTLIASLVLFSFRMLHWVVPACYVAVYAVLVKFFCPVFAGGTVGEGDILLSVLSGGTLFTAFFVLSWFGTTPLSPGGKVFYGVFAGVASFFISGYGMSPVGAMFTVLSANMISPVIQLCERMRSKATLYAKQLPKIEKIRKS